MNCIYCGRPELTIDAKGKQMRFSKEHILPSGLVGKLEDNTHFILKNVHQYCNNVAGMFIDAPAIKSWFVNMDIATNASKFLNIESNPIVPLKYIGTLDLTYEDKICEFWMGPAGSTIYHFHKPYSEEGNSTLVGVPHLLRIEKLTMVLHLSLYVTTMKHGIQQYLDHLSTTLENPRCILEMEILHLEERFQIYQMNFRI